MEIVIIVSLFLLWYILGAWGFIYWWTKDFDFTISDFVFLFIFSLLGPLAWLVGYAIHGNSSEKVIFKKKGN